MERTKIKIKIKIRRLDKIETTIVSCTPCGTG